MIETATAGMTPAELAWRREGKWSTAQVLDHLTRTYHGTVRGYEKALAAGRPLGTSATPWQHLARLLVTGIGYFPSGRKSPQVVEPASDCEVTHAGDAFRAELAKLLDAQARVEARFSGARVLDHPVLGPLTPKQWAKFHYVHARHHLKQIRLLREQMRPPSPQ